MSDDEPERETGPFVWIGGVRLRVTGWSLTETRETIDPKLTQPVRVTSVGEDGKAMVKEPRAEDN